MLLNTFFIKFIIKTCGNKNIIKQINDSIDKRDLILSTVMGCTITDYQTMLRDLTINKATRKLHWTNIYPPFILIKSTIKHRKEYSEKKVLGVSEGMTPNKLLINIISPHNYKQWQKDYSNGLANKLQKMATNNMGVVKYVIERDLE